MHHFKVPSELAVHSSLNYKLNLSCWSAQAESRCVACRVAAGGGLPCAPLAAGNALCRRRPSR